jgi:Nuclease-related domain
MSRVSDLFSGIADRQCDVRAPGALVVLEVKTWSGFVQGAAQAALWTRHGRGHEVVSVPNAVTQNRAHVDAIVRTIDDRTVPIWGLVVSAGYARFAPALRPHVVPAAELVGVLRAGVDGLMEGQGIQRAWALLSREADRSPERQAGHVAALRDRWSRGWGGNSAWDARRIVTRRAETRQGLGELMRIEPDPMR